MEEKFMPTTVESYRNLLDFKCNYTLKSNIIYNLQYLEYVLNSIKNNRVYLTSNLMSMNIKSYMICFISIIEAIFFIELKNQNLLKTEEYEKEGKSSDMFYDDRSIKITTTIRKKVEPHFPDLTIDRLIKKIEGKHVYPLLEHGTFEKLKFLKNLRNKVHLQIAKEPNDSDYNSFNKKDVNNANEVLLNILEHYSTNDEKLSKLPFNEVLL